MPGRGRPPHPDILTPREWEVLALLRDGLSNEQTAERLGISFATAKFHVSEIIGKLGVNSREEAARWQPPAPGASSRQFGMLPPLSLLRGVPHFVTPAASAATLTLAAIIVGALTWGVATSRGRATNGDWSVDGRIAASKPSVMLFDVATRTARRIAVPDSVGDVRWLKPGETLLAQQLDSKRLVNPPETPLTYRVYGVDGNGVWTVPPELTRRVIPAPGGDAVLIERADNQYLVANIPTGKEGTFLIGARDLAFSPDGAMAAYTTLGGGDQENVNHDWRTIFVVAKTYLTGFTGEGMAVQSQREADGAIDLAPEPWSPDGKYLLVDKWPACGAATCQGPPTFEVYDTSASQQLVWNQYAGDLLSAQWAGPGRLFVAFRSGAPGDPAYPGAPGLIVDFAGGATPFPNRAQSCCVVSFSPDGNYAVARVGTGNAGQQRCALYDVSTWQEVAGFDAAPADDNAGFCAVADWTPDGTKALVSSSTSTDTKAR